jgi:two-component system phosphate regulon sensor histidine kinase PhoR
MNETNTYEKLMAELEELRFQVQEANETIHAIKSGQIDALFIESEKGHQLYTLKTADQTYRVFIEKMKEGAVTLSQNEVILYSNSRFATMMEMPLSKVIGLSLREFIATEHLDLFDQLLNRGWISDSRGELLLKNGAGKLIPFLLSFSSLELDEGISLSVILTCLSVQKETEKELKMKNEQLEEVKSKIWAMNEKLEDIVEERTKDLLISREHFKFLADNIPVIVWTTKADGSPDYFNKRWYEYTGLNVEESQRSGLQSVIYSEDIEAMLSAWKKAIEHQSDFVLEYRLKRASDTTYRWFLVKGHPLIDDAGQVVAWFGTSTDIEDQKKEIEKKDEFISVASHELKTPLTSLKGYIQLIEQQKELSGNATYYIRKANDSLNKLQHLINDLLDVSKIHAGKLKFDKEVLNLSDLLISWIENCTYMYSTHTFRNEILPGFNVSGNAERLERVIMNLVSNAVKYSPDNKEIIIQAKQEQDRVIVSVTDSGIGLPETEREKIFDRFYRVNNNDNFATGLGMGLYISAEIIKDHHGTMSVESKIAKGSTISFSLPVLKE